MSVRLLSIALLMLSSVASAFGAKPPDLPQKTADDCCDCCEQPSYQNSGDGECCEAPCPASTKQCPATACPFTVSCDTGSPCKYVKHHPTQCTRCFSACVMGCVMESLLPGLGLCECCPMMRGKVEAVVQPCMKVAVSNCKQLMTRTAKGGCGACQQNACHANDCKNACHQDCCENDCHIKNCQQACHGDGDHECCDDGCYPSNSNEYNEDPCGECCKGECKCKEGCKCQEKQKSVGSCHQCSDNPCGECCKGECKCKDGCKCQEKKTAASCRQCGEDPCGECCKGECKCEGSCKCKEVKKSVTGLIHALIGKGCPMHVKVTVHVQQCPVCAMGNCASKGCCGWVGGWVFEAMMRKPEKLTVMPQEEATDTNSHANRSVCPYLQEQAAKQHRQKANDQQMAGSVLENMEKLIQARRVYLKAERCRHTGELAKAEACYEQAEKLCPGSRFEALAKAKLKAMHAKSHGEEAELFQRKEPLPCQKCEEQSDEPQATKDMKARFIELLNLARCCMEAGNLADAQKYAQEAANLKMEAAEEADSPLEQAKKMMESGCFSEARSVLMELYSADCTCAKVAEMLDEIQKAVVVKDSAEQVAELLEAAQRAYTEGCMEDAACLVEQALTLDPTCGAALYLRVMISQKRVEKGDVEQAEPPASYQPTPWGMRLTPTLPAIDPKIVDVLEKVMVEEEEHVRETRSDCEDAECPNIQIDDDGDLQIQDDAETEVVPTTDEPLAGAEESLRNLLQVMKQGMYVDADGNGRALVEMQIAGVGAQFLWNGWGHSYITFQLFPKRNDNLSDIDDSETCDEPLYLLETELGPGEDVL